MNGHAHGERGSSESARRVPLALQLLGAVLVVSSIFVGVFASHAGAAALSNGTVALKVSSSGAVATNPLANHQVVDLAVAANSTLSRSSSRPPDSRAEPCPSRSSSVPISAGRRRISPRSRLTASRRRSIPCRVRRRTGVCSLKGFTIYALPDPADLGVSNGTVCDDAEHQCVLGFFSNQNDFSKPHLFSAPFQVTSTGAATVAPHRPPARQVPSGSGSAAGGASAAVSVPPATLANTGGPTLWPWLLGAGFVLLLVGSALRYVRRPTYEERP